MPLKGYKQKPEHKAQVIGNLVMGHQKGKHWKIKDTSKMCGHHPKSEFKKGDNVNENNSLWKKEPGLVALHSWVRRRVVKPPKCPVCGGTKYQLELANISQEYKRDINDFEWLCHMCHMTKDGRINRLFISNSTL